MEAALFIVAAVVVAAFHGPTWAWAVLGTVGLLIAAVEAS